MNQLKHAIKYISRTRITEILIVFNLVFALIAFGLREYDFAIFQMLWAIFLTMINDKPAERTYTITIKGSAADEKDWDKVFEDLKKERGRRHGV